VPKSASVGSASSRRGWLALVVTLLAVVPGADAGADEPDAAVWFPSGAGSVTAGTYPEGTLHVGVVAGSETDRTYLRFGLDGGDPSSAVLTIPIDPDAGTFSPEAAAVAACAVPGGVEDGATTPPAVDCDGAPLATVADGDAPTLTVDVTSLLAGDELHVALVPVVEPGASWHVGFTTADLAVTRSSPPPASPASPPASPPAATPTTVSTPATIAVAPAPLPTPASSGATVAEQASPPTTIAPPAAVPVVPLGTATGGGFRYPIVFALPLILLVAIGLLGDGLTRPVRVAAEGRA